MVALLSLAGIPGMAPVIQSAHANPASSNASPGASGLAWQATTSFPLSDTFVSCSGYGGDVYCLADDQVHYAAISSTGVGTWSNSTPYPGTASYYPPACAASAGYIYCVGGTNGSPTSVTDAVYYAALSASGVGKWAQTTDYPTRIFSASCFASGGYLYCVGGEETIGAVLIASVYYAPISSSGVGSWKATTQYPIQIDDTNCVTSNGSAYCTGGVENVQGQGPTGATYYATVSPSGGLGAWAPTTTYPGGVQPGACVAAAGDVYCMGGSIQTGNVDDVNYAPISSTGIGAWTPTTSYPSGAGYPNYDGCVASGSYVYCVGSNSKGGPSTPVYYAEVSAATSSSTSQLMVSAQDLSGHALEGYTAVLNQSGTMIVATGYTPATFNLVDGQAYTVGVDGYGSCRFVHWLDTGSTVAIRPITVTNDTQITAVIDCSATTTNSSSSSSSSTRSSSSSSASSAVSSSSSISTSSSSRSASSSTTTSSSARLSTTSHSNDSTSIVKVPPPPTTTSTSSPSASRSVATATTSKTLDSSSVESGAGGNTTTVGNSSTMDTTKTTAGTPSQDSSAAIGLVGIIALVAAGIVVIGAAIGLLVRKR
jgi:hypothetical protein